jgi:peptidoglycan LD-endopeptidase LytH
MTKLGTLSDSVPDATTRIEIIRQRAAKGLEPHPDSLRLKTWLIDHRSSCGTVLPSMANKSRFCVFDFSAHGSDTMSDFQPQSLEEQSRQIFSKIEEANAVFGIGLYNEPRVCYAGSQFKGDTSSRTIHIGLDFFDRAGQIVLAPIAGTVHALADNALPFDYGPTVILEHEVNESGLRFWTLYGHLDRQTISTLLPGQKVRQGETIARLGTSDENGGWVPHLHFQLIVDLLNYEKTGDFPGVASVDEIQTWLSISPDPNLMLDIPAELNWQLKNQK